MVCLLLLFVLTRFTRMSGTRWTYHAQRLLLFLSTALYLPAVNTLIAPFANEYDVAILQAFGYAGRCRCCLLFHHTH